MREQLLNLQYDIHEYPEGSWQEFPVGWIREYKVKRLVKEFGYSALGLIAFVINEELHHGSDIELEDIIFAAADYSGETENTIKKMFRKMSEYGLILSDGLKVIIDGQD